MHARPNCVIVMTDSQGAHALSSYTGVDYGTDHLDRLAADGVRFDPAYAEIRDRLHRELLAEMNRVRDPQQGWGGTYRHRPDDGFMPTTLSCHTGKPPEPWVEP
jgi:hypothetical protein